MDHVYNELKSGRNAEELVAEFTKMLNDAEERIRAEEAAAAKADTKRQDFANLAHQFLTTIGTHYPDLGFDPAEVSDEVREALADILIVTIDLEAMKRSKRSAKREQKTAVDPFQAFFKQFGL